MKDSGFYTFLLCHPSCYFCFRNGDPYTSKEHCFLQGQFFVFGLPGPSQKPIFQILLNMLCLVCSESQPCLGFISMSPITIFLMDLSGNLIYPSGSACSHRM